MSRAGAVAVLMIFLLDFYAPSLRLVKKLGQFFHRPCGRGFAALVRPGILARERLTCDVRVPVYECAVWIVPPRPDVQRIEGGKTKAVWSFEVVEKLSHEFRRPLILLVPGFGENQKVRAN